MSDLGTYLNKSYGVCIGDIIMMHLLWADDLQLVSEGEDSMQKLLNGLFIFCKNNQTVVNEIKTKCMTFGKIKSVNLIFNGNSIEQVHRYKCLGTMINSTLRSNSNIFEGNAEYLCTKANKAIYAMANRTKYINPLSPHIKFHLFSSLVKPILTYGAEIWANDKLALNKVDKIFLRYIRCSLSVKASTSNIITIGECGQYPPSVACKKAILIYYNRLNNMPNTSIVKRVYEELNNLHQIGFNNWVSDVHKLIDYYNLDITLDCSKFKSVCKRSVNEDYKKRWFLELKNLVKNPILRTYNGFKQNFGQEEYLRVVKESKYRVAIAKLRCSSHTLAIEKGRYTRPKTPVNQRVCLKCKVLENEFHFVLKCLINVTERNEMILNITKIFPNYRNKNSLFI